MFDVQQQQQYPNTTTNMDAHTDNNLAIQGNDHTIQYQLLYLSHPLPQ